MELITNIISAIKHTVHDHSKLGIIRNRVTYCTETIRLMKVRRLQADQKA